MNTHPTTQAALERIATRAAQGDTSGLREELVATLARPGAAAALRALDDAGVLTRIIPELEPARDVDQPHVHFLPVLAHMLETVAALEWMLSQVMGWPRDPSAASPLPAAVQSFPALRYQSAYAGELRAHFDQMVGRYPRVALLLLAALLHDIAKPQTKQVAPDGVSFHEHQSIGGEVALAIARRLGFDELEAGYIRLVVREHMRPGQLYALDELTMRAVDRFFFATSGSGPDVLLHLLADHMATRGPMINPAAWAMQAAWVDAMLDTIWGEAEEPARPLLNGDALMRELGIAPGPLVGRLLAAIGEAQAGGDIATPEEALALARRLLP